MMSCALPTGSGFPFSFLCFNYSRVCRPTGNDLVISGGSGVGGAGGGRGGGGGGAVYVGVADCNFYHTLIPATGLLVIRFCYTHSQ